MYLLTIVFLASHISVTSPYTSREACEQAAERARSFTEGSQAVESASCAPLVPAK